MELQTASFDEVGLIRGTKSLSLFQLFDKYLTHFERKRGKTFKAKSVDFGHVLLFLGDGDIDRPTLYDFTKANIEEFLENQLSIGRAPSTVNRRLATLKHFSRMLAERIPHYHDDIRTIRGYDIEISDSKALSADEVKRIREFSDVGTTPFQCLRNKLIIELFHATGLRTDEVCSLTVGQYDGRYMVRVKAKGRKVRNVYLPTSLDALFGEYFKLWREEMVRRCDGYSTLSPVQKARLPLLPTFYRPDIDDPDSLRMSTEALRQIHYRIGELAGVKNLHPHRWKHTLLTNGDKKGIRLAVLQKMGGHSSATHTARYIKASRAEESEALEALALE